MLTTRDTAPVIVAQGLRKGSCGSPRGAKRLVTDALATVRKLSGPAGAKVLLRADSAFYGHGPVGAAVRAGAQVSVTVRLDPRVKAAIAAIDDQAWTPIQYTDAIFDQDTQTWISTAEVAEVPFLGRANGQTRVHAHGAGRATQTPAARGGLVLGAAFWLRPPGIGGCSQPSVRCRSSPV